jgi:hypothetical protein
MTDLFRLILGILASRFKARATLKRKPGPAATGQCASPANSEATVAQQYGLFSFVWLYRWFPSVLEAVGIRRGVWRSNGVQVGL